MIHYMSNNMLKVLYMAMVGLRIGGVQKLYTPLPRGTSMDQSFPAVVYTEGLECGFWNA